MHGAALAIISACVPEPGWQCVPSVDGDPTSRSVCTTTCGDGFAAGAEECDAGDPTATAAVRGCTPRCKAALGWDCPPPDAATARTVCTPLCADGLVVGGEQCDPPGPGCTANCTFEADMSRYRVSTLKSFNSDDGKDCAAANNNCTFHAYDLVQVENLPPGELAICSGMQIAATDGKVGKLDELVLDPETGDITHLLMRKGHLWGKREVAVPASSVDYVEVETIHLNVDKAAVEAMPTVSVSRPSD